MPEETQPQSSPAAPRTGKSRSRKPRLLLLLVAFGLGVSFVLLEIGARAMFYMTEQKRIEQWTVFVEQRTIERSKDPKRKIGLGDIIRPSQHHDVIYQLIPNVDVMYKGGRLRINENGFRGPAVPKKKGVGVFRIVGLGDSVMFGSGINNDEEYLQVMARKLNAAGLQSRVEVVNMGTPGYNTAMEVALLETIGLEWSPDLVAIDFVHNDYQLPNFIATSTNCLALDRSFSLEWALSMIGERKGGFEPLKRPPLRDKGGFEEDPERVPTEYRHMVGHQGYHRAMRRLAELSKEHGFSVVVSMHHGWDQVLEDICEELGFLLVLGRTSVNAYESEKGITKYLGSELTVSETDPHPSKIQHRILGEYYAQKLLQSGFAR